MAKVETVLSIFHTEKPLIGMIHLKALPGSESYNHDGGLEDIISAAREDYNQLLEGGIDAVLFCNENDKPYRFRIEPHVISMMTFIVEKIVDKTRIPFGIDIQWDPFAALGVAITTNADFIRGALVGAFSGDLGLYSFNLNEFLDYRRKIGAGHIRIFSHLTPEFSYSLDNRTNDLRAASISKSSSIDGLCVLGEMVGKSINPSSLSKIKEAVGDFPIFASNGINSENVKEILGIVDGGVVGSSLKRNRKSWERIDSENVIELMKAKNLR